MAKAATWVNTDAHVRKRGEQTGLAIFAIPAAISAFSDSRPPRAATVGILVAGALILLAFYARPGGYTLKTVPDAVARVLARVVNY